MPCTRPIHGWKSTTGTFTLDPKLAWRDRHMSVPCGRCLDCKLEISRQWSVRIMHESLMHATSSFITLTYSDENLPHQNKTYPLTATILKRDIQLFIKRLRKSISPEKIRYFACGEYGDQTNRPHYHAIIFNYWPKDTKFYKDSGDNRLYKSESLNKAWKKGYCIIGSVTFESASYTASYVTKKITGNKADKHYNGRQPEFALMSNRHGIGYSWYQKYKEETWNNNNIIQRGKTQLPPQYYYKLLKKEDEQKYKDLKIKFPNTRPPWFNEWESIEDQIKKQKYRSNYSKLTKAFHKKQIL